MTALLLALALQAAIPPPSPPAPPAPAAILVMPPQAPAGAAWIAEGVADALPAALTELGLEAVPRSDRMMAHAALEIPPVELSRATAIRLAEALGARRVVVGSLEVPGERVNLSLRLLDIERGTLSAPLLASGTTAELPALVDGLAADIALAVSATSPLTREQLRARHVAVTAEAWSLHAKALAARQPLERVRLARRAVEAAPSFDAARLNLAGLLLDAREFSAAHDVLTRIPASSPHARRARFLMGVCLLELGRFREAAALFAALVAERATPGALNNQGLAVLRGGVATGATATELLRRAVDLEPSSTDLAFNLGWAFLVEKQPLAAEYWLRGVLAHEPLHGPARVALAWALRAAGQAARADEEWKGVVAIAPDWQGQRQPDPGRKFEQVLPSERVLSLDRQSRSDAEVAATLIARGERLLDSGDAGGALRELNRAAYLDPYKPRVHVALARAHRARGEREKAENELRMALWSKDEPQVRLELATLLRDMGRVAESRAEAEKVLQGDPGNAAAQRLLQP